MKNDTSEFALEAEYEIEKIDRCARGACLTKDRVIHKGKIVCKYCLRGWEPCEHPKSGICSDCDTTNLETV